MKMMQILTSVAIMLLTGVVQAKDTEQIINDLKNSEPIAPVIVPDPASVVVTEPAPAVAAPASATVPEEELETVSVAEEPVNENTLNKDGLISVNLKEVELSSVIRLFSTLSGANIIVPELGEGAGVSKVDVSLTNVEWKPALQAILDGQDLELYEKIPSSEVYSIRKKLPAAEAIKNTRTFVFQNADIQQAEEVIKGIVGERGQVYAYAQGNAIVVKTTQEIMDDVAQIAERIDTSRQQVLIEARILELSNNKNKDHGVDWSQEGGLLSRSISAGPFSWIQTDVNSGHFGQITPSAITPASGDTYLPELNINQLTLDAGTLKAFISALDQFTDIQTVSSPKVIVANGEKATIKIITKEPIIISTPSYSDQGQLQSIMYNQEPDGTDPDTGKKRYSTYDYGIMLDVTPTIYSRDNIAVHIVPTISRKDSAKTITRDISGDSSQNPKIIEFPVIDEKRVETYFTLADRQTAVIGGLTETTKQNIEKKVPILSSIPLLKKLFSYTSLEDVQKENVIFVTVSLEDGKSFDIEKAVKQSPLTRKQLIRDENNQIIDDRTVELFKAQDDKRVADEIKTLEKRK